jgi:hypothetical protein
MWEETRWNAGLPYIIAQWADPICDKEQPFQITTDKSISDFSYHFRNIADIGIDCKRSN